ncbi:MAG TPA: sulfite exporter TauE/SafE family protein [Burkholderiales bacterium]|nr:sulfite exporter TauE/SafE family protein [Burkholderiales bacterium]
MEQSFLFIALAFLLAGFVKGAIGVGLPTVVMGLLSIVMPPAQAAGLMVLPAIGTNIWQMTAGPALAKLVRRLAGMIVGVFIGTFATIGLMTRSAAGASAALGLVLAAYGAYALLARRFEVEPRHERWLSPFVGLVTGTISGATGVFVIPTVPYLTALRMEREELVQSIGISAFVCPLAITLALLAHGRYGAALAGGSLAALFPALAGMYVGQRIRRRLPAATFMRWFFISLIALGGYMFARAIYR